MIECQAVGDATAPVVADEAEAVEAEPAHDLDLVGGHGAL